MYFTVIKHDGHLRTPGKCRKHSRATRVSHISLVFSNARHVLSQCNKRLRLPQLLYDIEVMWRKTIKHPFFLRFVLRQNNGYTLSIDQCSQGPIEYIIILISFEGCCNNLYVFLVRIFFYLNL